jgi:hypothetical protein
LFIIVPALSLPVIFLYYPETKGLSLEEIGTLFGDELAHVSTAVIQDVENAEKVENVKTEVLNDEKGCPNHNHIEAVG